MWAKNAGDQDSHGEFGQRGRHIAPRGGEEGPKGGWWEEGEPGWGGDEPMGRVDRSLGEGRADDINGLYSHLSIGLASSCGFGSGINTQASVITASSQANRSFWIRNREKDLMQNRIVETVVKGHVAAVVSCAS